VYDGDCPDAPSDVCRGGDVFVLKTYGNQHSSGSMILSLCVACGSGRGRTSSSGVGCTVGATATGDAGITLLGRGSGR
jgi:hypothetical protein